MAQDAADRGEGEDAPGPREWRFTQWFRKSSNDQTQDAGIVDDSFDISAVEFDDDGQFLATGDNSGNIVVLKNDADQARSRDELVRYVFHSEFQSHFQEFDYVSSTPILERINSIKWGPQTNDSLFLLSTSCKHIKLWKMTEREPIRYVNLNVPFRADGASLNDQGIPIELPNMAAHNQIVKELKVPRIVKEEALVITSLKKWYPHEGHSPTISHLGVSPDKANFVSADFFKINLWDLFRQDACYTIADFMPTDGSPPREVVTALDYHPQNSHLFIHGSNLGKVRMVDMRERALADQAAKTMCSVRDPKLAAGNAVFNPDGDNMEEQASLFDEVTSGVAGAKFSRGGKYVITRDFMSVKIWDVSYEKRPFETFYIHEFLREHLFNLYQSDALADAFSLGLSGKGDIVTGSYSNHFHLFELSEKRDVFIKASGEPVTISPIKKHNKKRVVNFARNGATGGTHKPRRGLGMPRLFGAGKKNKPEPAPKPAIKDDYPLKLSFETDVDLNKKILDCAWHPTTNAVAVTGQNSLYIYSK